MVINDMPSMAILWRIYLKLVEIRPQEKIPQSSGVSLIHTRQIMVAEHFVKRLEWIIHTINRELNVEPAFPCAMKRDARYEVRIKRNDGKFQLMLFAGRYAAKKYIEAVINNREILDLSYESILINDEIKVTSKKLRAILNHEYTADEAAWQLPLPYNYYAHVAATGDKIYRGDTSSRKSSNVDTGATSSASRTKKRRSSSNAETPARNLTLQRGKRTSTAGTFGIAELAAAIHKPASKIRSILRAKVAKPTGGWEWPTEQFEEIKKKIQS